MQAWSAQPIEGTILGVRLPTRWRMPARAAGQERLRYVRSRSVAKSIAFWAVYTGAIASASIASFSIVRGDRDHQPMIDHVQSPFLRGTEAIAMPGSLPDRPMAAAHAANPKLHVVSADARHAPELLRPGELDSVFRELLQQSALGVPENIPATRREAELPQRPYADPPHAAVAPRGLPSQPTVLVALSSATPAGTLPHSDTDQPRTGEPPHAAPKGETKAIASVPTEKVSAAPPSRAPAAKRHSASTRSRSAESKRYVARRIPAGNPRSVPAAPRSGAYYADSARGYGYGAYVPAPYSETGD